jgi:hypothetical protein
MLSPRVILVVAVGCICVGYASGRAPCQESGADSARAPSKGESSFAPVAAEATGSAASATEFDDHGLDRYLDLRLLSRAWESHDASALLDIGLLLAEGERVMLRNNRDFDSKKLIQLSAYLAGVSQDQATLARLSKLADQRRDQKMSALLKIVPQAMSTPTADAHLIGRSIEAISPQGLLVHQATLKHIRVISICGDKESLESMRTAVQSLTDLSPEQKSHVLKYIDDHSKNIALGNPELRPVVEKLGRLNQAIMPAP